MSYLVGQSNRVLIMNDVTIRSFSGLLCRANYTLRNGTERNGTTSGVHERVEIK